MKSSPDLALYFQHYVSIGFERAGLFELVSKKFRCREVLYPGCHVHITPSLFFPYLIYVDKNPVVSDFFANQQAVQEYLTRHRVYRQSAHFVFVGEEYAKAANHLDGKYDALISLFSPGACGIFKDHVKVGGIIISNNFAGDVECVASDTRFDLAGIIRRRKKKYAIVEDDLSALWSRRRKVPPRKYTRNTSSGIEYVDDEDYLIFTRMKR